MLRSAWVVAVRIGGLVVMAGTKTTNILMWVGASDYPTVTSFVREASKLGVSKRVARGQVPVGVKPGRSLLFLAHDEAVRVTCASCGGRGVEKGKLRIELLKKKGRLWEPVYKPSGKGAVEIRQTVATAKKFRDVRDSTFRRSGRKQKWRSVPGQKLCPECRGRGERPDGRIFGFCVVERLELMFDCASAATEYRERRETLKKRDRVPVTCVSGVGDEPRRRCGYRRVGAHYLVSTRQEALENAQGLAVCLGIGFKAQGTLVVFPVPVAYPKARFRASKVVDKNRILRAAKTAAEKLDAASPKKKRRAKKRGK